MFPRVNGLRREADQGAAGMHQLAAELFGDTHFPL